MQRENYYITSFFRLAGYLVTGGITVKITGSVKTFSLHKENYSTFYLRRTGIPATTFIETSHALTSLINLN